MADSRKSRSSDPVSAARCRLSSPLRRNRRPLGVGLLGRRRLCSVFCTLFVLAMDRVSALHVHHGLNSAADQWVEFCRHQCDAWSIPLSVACVTVERSSVDGLEAAARRARHAAYDRIVADWILLAHHQGDRAETMLFNLLRGAGVRGAGAMRQRNGRLLRPMLPVTRTDILAYARAHRLAWVDDESNADTRYARNFLRHRIMPATSTALSGCRESSGQCGSTLCRGKRFA